MVLGEWMGGVGLGGCKARGWWWPQGWEINVRLVGAMVGAMVGLMPGAGATTARAPPVTERLNFAARETLKKKFQAAQTFQGTLRTPCWLIFFFFHKTCNIYDTTVPTPCRQPPSSACSSRRSGAQCACQHPGLATDPLLGNCSGAELGRASIITPRFSAAWPAAPGMATEEMVPFLSGKER